MKCKDCKWCITDDGSPYCLIQDLYTNVNIELDCKDNCGNDKSVINNAIKNNEE